MSNRVDEFERAEADFKAMRTKVTETSKAVDKLWKSLKAEEQEEVLKRRKERKKPLRVYLIDYRNKQRAILAERAKGPVSQERETELGIELYYIWKQLTQVEKDVIQQEEG